MNKRNLSFLFLISLIDVTASAATRYVATTGSDTADCSNSAAPCLTLQYAINQAVSGDTIRVAAGTYVSTTRIDIHTPNLTFLGAQAGIDARTRSGPETVLHNTIDNFIRASNNTFDGFTIENDFSVGPAAEPNGISVDFGVDGTTIINNIFQNNTAGIIQSNVGNSVELIQHNLFRNSYFNAVNFDGGNAISSLYGQPGNNVVINENKFENIQESAIIFATDPATPYMNISVTNNEINTSGRGIVIYSTNLATVSGNVITNTVATMSGARSAGIAAFGSINGLSVTGNNLNGGFGYGMIISSSVDPNNTSVEIHQNNITGYSIAGMTVDTRPDNPVPFATCNWWGSASGPFNVDSNPTGTGNSIINDVILPNYCPWLTAPAPSVCSNTCPPSPNPSPSPSPNPSPSPSPSPGPARISYACNFEFAAKGGSAACEATGTAVVTLMKIPLRLLHSLYGVQMDFTFMIQSLLVKEIRLIS